MNKIKVLVGAGFLVGLVAVSVVFLRGSDVQKNSGVQWVSVDGSNLTDSEKRFVDNAKRAEKESGEKIKKTLIDGFTLSSQRNAPDVGDRFPNEKIIDPKYQSISFKNKITTIIIGQGTAEGPEQIAEQFKPYIQNKSLNLVRIVTSGSLPTNSLATAVIDARNPEDTRYANTSPGKVANWLSLPRSPVAYLIDQNGIIIYSKFSGGYTDPEELPKYLKSYLVEKIKLTAQRKTLKLNQRVDLANLDFVPKAILEKYLKPKSGTTVLIFTQPECNACEGIKGGINEGIKRWQGGGNGVILINADPAIANGYDEKNGALNISDNKRKMIDYFKIDRWPYVIFLQNQKEYGNIDYMAVSRITEFEKIDSNNPNMVNKIREVKERINNQPFMEAIDYAIASLR